MVFVIEKRHESRTSITETSKLNKPKESIKTSRLEEGSKRILKK